MQDLAGRISGNAEASTLAWIVTGEEHYLEKVKSFVLGSTDWQFDPDWEGGSLAYATAKGAVLTLTRALSVELGPVGIRVNALAPGLILGTSFQNTHTTDDDAQATIAGIPIGRGGAPEDIARAAVYLASEYDGFISGATLDINGGAWCG